MEEAKPSPDVFLAGLAEVDASPEDAIVVGDTGWDVQAAGAARIPAVAVCSGGWTRADLSAAGAVEVHDDVGALAAAIETSALGDHLRA